MRLPRYDVQNDGAGPYAVFYCDKCGRDFRTEPAIDAGSVQVIGRSAIEGLLRDFPQVRAVAFNGATAAKAGRKMIGAPPPGVELFDLPSSSAANTIGFADKARAWAVLAPFVAA